MRPPLYGMGLALELLTGGLLLLGASSASDVQSFCDKLINRDETFGIWALGYAGESFYVLTSHSIGYEIARSNVHIHQNDWIIDMSSAKQMAVKGMLTPDRATGMIGNHKGTSFAILREFYIENGHDVVSTVSVMKLGQAKLEEMPQDGDPFGNHGFEWDSYTGFFTSEMMDKFIVQRKSDGTVIEGTLNATNKGIHMRVNFKKKLGFIDPKSNHLIGFMHNGNIYAMGKYWEHQYEMSKYKLGADGSKDSVDKKPLTQVFCPNAKAGKSLFGLKAPGPSWDAGIKYLLGMFGILAVMAVVALAIVGFAKKSNSGGNSSSAPKSALKKKASSRTFSNPSSAKSSLRGSSKTTSQTRKLALKR